MTISDRRPIVRYLDKTDAVPCPFGDVRRIVTGGAGGVANLHVVRVTRGDRHFHAEYNEVYYILKGRGFVTFREERYAVRPGAVVVIPAGVAHSLESEDDEPLEFVIFGTPAMSMDDDRAKPVKP